MGDQGGTLLEAAFSPLPIVTNRSATAAADGRFVIAFAAYFPDGVIAFDARGFDYSLAPGEKHDAFDGIDRKLTNNVPLPRLITLYDTPGVATTYALDTNCLILPN